VLQVPQRLKALAGYLILLIAFLCWARVCTSKQAIGEGSKGDFLPPTDGQPLTVTPSNKPDVSCSVVEWNAALTKPTLTVLCPPEEIFAPLHVYLKISWLKAEDVPADTRGIRAPARTPTKLRTNKTAVWLWLGVQEKQDAPPRKKWIPFSGVVDVALLSLPDKRYDARRPSTTYQSLPIGDNTGLIFSPH